MEGINLIDTTQYSYGSPNWQLAMENNIKLKMEANEELNVMENVFIKYQRMENRIEPEQYCSN